MKNLNPLFLALLVVSATFLSACDAALLAAVSSSSKLGLSKSTLDAANKVQSRILKTSGSVR